MFTSIGDAQNVGIGTSAPADKLEVNGNIRLSGQDTIYAAPSTTGSGKSIWISAGNPYVPVGGSGGSIYIKATNNMPAGGVGYTNLGPSGDINLVAGSGYNTAGGKINITAGQTSCWALPGGNHSDVTISGGQNLAVTDASSITVEGGYTIGTSCPPPGATGGNLILKAGLGSGTGTAGNIQLLNGNVGIGTAAPTQKLHVAGNICYTGSIAACSDMRYKTNVTPLKDPVQKLLLLKGVNYYWKKTAFPDMNFNENKQIGFIAQEVEQLFPELVFTDINGYKSIDYSRLTPLLVETVKEQQKEISAINKRLNALERKWKKTGV